MSIGMSGDLADRLPNAIAVVEATTRIQGARSIGREAFFEPDEIGHTILQDLPALVDAAQTLAALVKHIMIHFTSGGAVNPPRGSFSPIDPDDDRAVIEHIRHGIMSGSFAPDPARGAIDPRNIPYEDRNKTAPYVGQVTTDPQVGLAGDILGPQVPMGEAYNPGPPVARPENRGPMQWAVVGLWVARKLPELLALIKQAKGR